MKNKILRLLAVMGALLSTTPKVSGAEAQENTKVSAKVSVFANTEQVGHDSTFGDLAVVPNVSVEKGDVKVGYAGSFYNWRNADKEHGNWGTSMNRVQLENDDYAVQAGLLQLKPSFASYLKVPMSTTLGNDIVGAGSTRKAAGVHLTDKDSGIGLGVGSKDNHISGHWDTARVTWEKRWNPMWETAAHLAMNKDGVDSASATVAYSPSDRTNVVAEGLYNGKKFHAIVGANHKLREDLALFAGAKFSQPEHGKMEGWLGAGAKYNFYRGLTAVAGVRQNIGADHQTQAIIGLQYAGNYGLGGN